MPSGDQTTDIISPTRWAAYVLGRHPVLVRAWQRHLKDAATADVPLASVSNEAPGELKEFDVAVRELTLANSVHPAILVELHRSWDLLARACRRTVKMVARDDPAEIEELFWSSRDDWLDCQELAAKLLPDPSLQAWCRFGHQIAQVFLTNAENLDNRCYFPVDDFAFLLEGSPSLLDEWQQLCKSASEVHRTGELLEEFDKLMGVKELSQLPAVEAAEARRLHQAGGNLGNYWAIKGKLVDEVASFDTKLRELLAAPQPTQPLLIIDESQELLTFLDRQFTFEEFRQANANGGLRCYVVLARQPGRTLLDTHLIEEAELGCSETQLESYFSRFRAVMRRAIGDYQLRGHGRLPANAHKLFIKKKYDSVMKRKTYQLTLDPRLVRHIGKSS